MTGGFSGGYRSDQPRIVVTRTLGNGLDASNASARQAPANYRSAGPLSVIVCPIKRVLAMPAMALPLLVADPDHPFDRNPLRSRLRQPDHHAPTPPPRTRRLMLSKNYGLIYLAAAVLFSSRTLHITTRRGRVVYRNGPGPRSSSQTLIIVPQIVVAL